MGIKGSTINFRQTLLACSITCIFAMTGCTPNNETLHANKTSGETAEVTSPDMSESQRLNAWFDAKYEEQLQFSPVTMTMQGRKGRYGEIDDLSQEAEDKQLAWRKASVEELRNSFDYNKLDNAAKISFDLWIYEYQRAADNKPFTHNQYTFNQMFGMHTMLPTFLINYHNVDSVKSLDDYISRLKETGRAVKQLVKRAKISADSGVMPPYFAVEGVIEQSKGIISGYPFDDSAEESAIYADLKRKTNTLVESGELSQKDADSHLLNAKQVLTATVAPAYQSIIDWYQSELPTLDKNAKGVWSLPDGEAYYKARLAASTTTNMTAEEIHQLGLEEVARLRGEFETVKEQLKFEGDLEAFFNYVRDDKTDERFYYPNTPEGREAYLKDARNYITAMKARLPDYFGRLPKADLVVKRVEPFRETPGGAQHYYPSSPDGSNPGVYYVHLADMTMTPKSEMEAIAYHEGVPGHHMQLAIAQELKGVPTFRTQASFTAYIEGWALYAERLASDMGAYEDPISNFGRLHSEMWRAIRLVLDTGIHSKKWTEEESIAYFLANSPISEGQAKSEVRRYFVMPGQAASYKIGMLKILELREKAKAALGDKFDISEYHDLVLGGGAVPLSVLESIVDNWIVSKKSA